MKPIELIEKTIQRPNLNKSGIYLIYCINSGKGYVGRASSLRGRFKHHKRFLRSNEHVNRHLQNAFNLYGENAFCFFVLEQCDRNDLYNREGYFVSIIDEELRYNIAGIKDVLETPKDTREKISASLKGIKRSDEFKEKMRKASIKREARRRELGLKKTPISDTHRANLKIASTGRTHSEDTKLLIGTKSKGRVDSEETKLKKSDAQKKRQLLIRQNRSKLEAMVN